MTAVSAPDGAMERLLADAAAVTGADATAFDLVYRATVAAAAVSPALAAPHVARLWFTPWRVDGGPAAAAREAAWTVAARRTSYAAAGFDIPALEMGAGPTALLVHGWGDHSARLGAFLEPIAAAGMRAVAVDLPGHGALPPHETDLYEWAAVVRDLLLALDARAVVAHSLGAVAAVASTARPSSVEAVALLAPAVRLEHAVTRFQSMLSLPDEVVPALRLAIEQRFGPGVWRQWRADEMPVAPGVRTLVVHSPADGQVDVADGRLLAGSRPRTSLHEPPDVSHTRVLRDPDVLHRVVSFVTSGRGT